MIAVEFLLLLLVAAAIFAAIAKIGAPIAEAFANRLKLKFQELAPEEERILKARMAALEEEVRLLKDQVADVRQATEFAVKLLEDKEKKK